MPDARATGTLPLAAMYQERILEHFRAPHGRGLPEDPAVRVAERRNPLCGDALRVGVVLRGDVIEAVGFDGSGCSIATASASMLTGTVRGQTVAEALRLASSVERFLHGDAHVATELPGDLPALAGVARHPQRVGCARMAWQALTEAIADSAEPLPRAAAVAQ
ncbi:MAG: SUF system NifU family Fe-S cluster assembly protein [Gemmatimonadaceae bacterium]|jgi:nitrogen fixation NifU-like protein|nr:SUF system NifU family Fe-S cluster assembly protein [Gemmatimonadaceae bacterium]